MRRDIGDFELDTESSAFLAIDFQKDILLDDAQKLHPWAVDVVERTAELVAWCRTVDIPVIWIGVQRRPDYADVFSAVTDRTHGGSRPVPQRLLRGTEGVEFVPPLVVEPHDYAVIKPRVSAFHATPLDGYLKRLGAETLIVSGVYTHMGVESTIRSAYDRDLITIVASDACGGPWPEIHEHALTKILPAMSMVRTVSQLIGD